MTASHLSLGDRITISHMLDKRSSFKQIALAVGKSCSSVSREVKRHMVFRKSGAPGIPYNNCLHRKSCEYAFLCPSCSSSKRKRCSFCSACNSHCPDFEKDICRRLDKPPYVCNGCPVRSRCSLEKRLYNPSLADQEYRAVLSEARSGLSYSEEEIRHLDSVVSPLLFKGQSLNHICANNKDSLMVSESTLYRLLDYNCFSARNIDLPRKVRFSKRKVKKNFKVDKACRLGRSFTDYLSFCRENPDLPVTQLDSVLGSRGGKVLLTIHFVKAELMLAFLRDSNDSQSVINIFERLYWEMGPDTFSSVMPLLLTDNGSEFSNPSAIEFDREGNRRTRIFYCDPSSPGQKGSAEKNHEFIRYVLPKGSSFNALSQQDVSLLMNHINSYARESLGNKCPFEMFEFLYGSDVLRALGCRRIPPNEVNLSPALLRGCNLK